MVPERIRRAKGDFLIGDALASSILGQVSFLGLLKVEADDGLLTLSGFNSA
jgi:hypothetical protein